MSEKKPKRRPSQSTSHQQSYLVSLALEVAEEMLLNRTAPASLVTQILRSATIKDELERDILAQKKVLLSAQTEQIANSANSEEKYNKVLKAMKKYSGNATEEDDFDEEY